MTNTDERQPLIAGQAGAAPAYAPPLPPTTIGDEKPLTTKTLNGTDSKAGAGVASALDADLSTYELMGNATVVTVPSCRSGLSASFDECLPAELVGHLDEVHWKVFVHAVNHELRELLKECTSLLGTLIAVIGIAMVAASSDLLLFVLLGLLLVVVGAAIFALMFLSVWLHRYVTPVLHRRKRRHRQRVVCQLNHLLGPLSPIEVDLVYPEARSHRLLDYCELEVRWKEVACTQLPETPEPEDPLESATFLYPYIGESRPPDSMA
mmetsp:Transcript_342/g.782  ORF Transcript_342/g.782 Transcript_342/m.782 type:complete len:265 (-) Transcript_342:159-953(-)